MGIAFECANCEADFELEIADILRDPTLVKCPNCGNKANPAIIEAAFMALDEFLEQVKRIHRRFRVNIALEAEEIVSDDDIEYDDELDNENALWESDVEEDEDEDEL